MSGRMELLDPGAPGVDDALLDALIATGVHRRVVVIGDRRTADSLSAMGFEVLGRVAASPGESGMSAWSVGRRVRRVLSGIIDDHETVVGTWSEHALAAALYAGLPADSIDPVVVAASGPPVSPPLASRILGATPRSAVEVRAVGQAAGPALSRRGWRLGPAIDPRSFAPVIPRPAPSVVDRGDMDLVVGLSAGPPELADARFACQAMISLAAAGCAGEIVISSRAGGVREAARWMASAVEALPGSRPRLRIDDRIDRPGSLASELDVVLVTAPGRPWEVSSSLTLRSWLAAGVPAIAPDDRTLRGLVQDGVDARVVPGGDRNAVVRAMIRLAEDPELRVEMSHAAASRHLRRVRGGTQPASDQGSGSFEAKSRAASR